MIFAISVISAISAVYLRYLQYLQLHAHLDITRLSARHYFTSSNCIFMQLQGIVFDQLQGNDMLLTFKEIHSFKERKIILFTKNISQ